MAERLAAYYRTSLEDFNRAHGLADQSQSIENQRKVVMEYLRGNEELSGYSVLEFIDDGLTGTNTDRPQFQAMIEAARRGEVSCVIVKDLRHCKRPVPVRTELLGCGRLSGTHFSVSGCADRRRQ